MKDGPDGSKIPKGILEMNPQNANLFSMDDKAKISPALKFFAVYGLAAVKIFHRQCKNDPIIDIGTPAGNMKAVI
ncbi:hypothetical protein RJ640_026363 [Escallonia rubra]|uniref:Uncharacterized protein n=1 Tax=Escallonia rubra TaxID=112253 RepID=A0AA88RTT6_9ASTE|nr:hypothetical protein RJ640_026363 [Escallonia rubra]